MKQRPVDTPYILRYVYAMLAVVLISVVVVMGSLYVYQLDESETRDQVQSFHLESYVEADLLLREGSTLRALIEDAIVSGTHDLSVVSTRQFMQISYGSLLQSMQSRLEHLSALQGQYQSRATALTLERLVNRFDRVDRALRGATVKPETTGYVDSFTTTVTQFGRLHTIAADDALRELEERQSHRPRFLAVLILCVVFAALAIWYLVRSLGRSLARQRRSEAALADTQERLQNVQRLDALARLVGGVAHDFNNLLTAVLGHTELLRESSTGNESFQTGLKEIRTAGLRAAELTKQLLAFSRRQHADRSVLHLNELIQDMEVLLQRTLGDNIRLTCTYTDDPYLVELDPGQFQQVMMNLASNARDAMPGGGSLGVITENVSVSGSLDGIPDGEYLQLSVTDSGTGMNEATRQRLFEPFFTTKEKHSGTGLGLSTVHGIVMDSGGHIVVDTEEGKGTEFRICFPRTSSIPETPASQSAEPTRSQKGSETILVVDDDRQMLNFVEKGLSSLGYRVLTASGGQAGLEICREEPGAIDAIVSDVVMSGLNGPKFMESALRLRPHAAAVYISAYTEDILLWRPNQQQEIPLVTKPFEMQTLAQTLRDGLHQFEDSTSSSDSG